MYFTAGSETHEREMTLPRDIKQSDSQDLKSNVLTPSPVCFYHIMVISVKIVAQKLSGSFKIEHTKVKAS